MSGITVSDPSRPLRCCAAALSVVFTAAAVAQTSGTETAEQTVAEAAVVPGEAEGTPNPDTTDTATSSDADLSDPFAALDAPAWADRQAAMQALMTDPGVSDADLADAYVDPATSLEARQRLERVLRHRIIAGFLDQAAGQNDPGSLGITHPGRPIDALPQHAAPEIVVLSTLPGFPAYPQLRGGDVIVRFNHEPLPAAENDEVGPSIRDVIHAHRVGDTVPIHLVRDGQVLRVDVTLASSTAMGTVFETEVRGRPIPLRPVYRLRLERQLRDLTTQALPPVESAQTEPVDDEAEAVSVHADATP